MSSALATYSTIAPRVPLDTSRPLYYVPSSKNPNQSYTVGYTLQGILRCECKAADFPKSAGRCRHLRDVRAGLVKPATWKQRATTVVPSRPVITDELIDSLF